MVNLFKRKKNNINFEELDKKNIMLGLLEIIVTKKCNLACAHCMRGDAQNQDITKETYDAIFDKIQFIENLNLGGGEISLSPKVITDLIASLKEHKTIVNSFALTTNGTIISQEFIDALLELKEYVYKCREEKITIFKSLEKSQFHIVISTDDFHLNEMIKKGYTLENLLGNIQTYRQNFGDDSVEFKGYCDFDLIDEGRAKDLPPIQGISKSPQHPLTQKFSYTNLTPKTNYIDGFLSISTDGEVLPGCNYSFENEKIFTAGNIKEKKLSEIFSHLDLIPVEIKDLNKFRHKMVKASSVDEKSYKRYFKANGNKKERYLWMHSQPEK